MRLVTGDPDDLFDFCVTRLTALTSAGSVVVASKQVIGDCYVALQHHYGVAKTEARAGLHSVLSSGLVLPCRGSSALTILEGKGGCGLLDRLIADEYAKMGLPTLTLDKKMASLQGVEKL